MTAENKHKCLFFGEYKGVPLNKVPLGYLARTYASFEEPRKVIEPELRRRGAVDNDLTLMRKRYPFLGKRPEKQPAKKWPPTPPAVSSRQRPTKPASRRRSGASPSSPTLSHPPALARTDRDLPSIRTSTLKRMYCESNGSDKAVEEELRTRGLNSRELTDLERSHSERRWREQSKKAHKVARKRKQSVCIASNIRHSQRREERRRQERKDRVALLKKGVVITGENCDPSASDGSCPF
ncbi:MAG: hypothetical protein K8S94_14575 [Planctomycetia bacterium]|jgi:hypothetical protein|nr:hypothetical protein [Planctomycetia bacterium]